MINGSAINGASINGSGANSEDLVDSFSFSTSLLYNELTNIIDQLNIVTTSGNSVRSKELLTNYIVTLDNILLGFKGSLSDSILLSQTLTAVITQLEYLNSTINTIDTASTKVVLISSLLSLITILESFGYRSVATISETIVISSTLTSLYKSLSNILDSLSIVSSTTGTHIQILSILDSLSLSSTLSSSSLFKNGISDSFIISIPTSKGSDKYLAYLLSPETNSISNYNNYNFDGCTKFGNKYLFYNSTGLYEYGGDLDDTAIIRARIETIAYNFGNSNLKQVPLVYLGVNTLGATFIKVRVDGKADVTYKLNKKTSGLQTQKIDVGKGLIGRYFQFEIVTDSPLFNMESIEFFPIELKRKL